jgi:hypothetical protein
VAYQITNTDGVNYADVWATIGNFTGGAVTLGASAADMINLGPLANGQTKTAFFYLRSTVSDTNVAQTHTVSVFNGLPNSSNLLTSQNFSFTAVVSTINANPNEVTSVVVSTATPALGGNFTITVTGQTGTIGAARVFDLTPAAYTSWRADAFQLTGTTITLSGANAGVFTETLLIPPGSLPSTANTAYTAVYTFRVVGTSTTPTAVSPVAYISSGQPVKHTNTGNFANLPPVQPPVNATVLDKTVAFSGLNTVTYTLTVTNSAAVDISLDRIVDILPSSPADVTYVAGTALFDGTPISDPDISGQTLTFTNLFTIPARSSRTLVYQAHFPDISGTYTNSAVGFVGDVQIDTTLDTTDNAPAMASFTVPALTTTPIPGAVTLGLNGPVTLTDTATLAEGNSPTGMITFTLVGAGVPAGGHTETVTVNGNGNYTTPTGFTLPTTGTVAGVYQWNAVYSGDANNAPVSLVGDTAEQVTVNPASPRLNTTPTLVPVGGTLQDSADLAGGFFPTGTITFSLYEPGVDPTVGPATHTEMVMVSGDGTYHTTMGFVANMTGIWHWVATYGGDPNNIAVSTVLPEPVNVPELGVPSLVTAPDPAGEVMLGPEPVTLRDSALLGGELSPGGTITFTLVGPGVPVGGHTETVTVTGNGLYTTPNGFTLPSDGSTVTGTYQWNVSYSGDSFNQSIDLVNDPTERVTVVAASPTVKTTADPSGTIPLNSSLVTLTDTATLEGGFNPSGTITFTLDFNNGTTTTTVYTNDVMVDGNGTFDTSMGTHPGGFTLPTTGPVVGTYTWHVHYSGDGNNIAADDQNGVHEQVTIDPATPALETVASPPITLGTTAPTLSDTVVLSGGYFPTGTLTFTLNGPGGFSFTEDVPVNGNDTYNTSQGNNPGGFTLPTTGMVAGLYTWTVRYNGDHNNNTATDQGGPIEQTMVDPARPTIFTTADPTGTIELGTTTTTTLNDSAVLSGGYFPAGGILTFKLFFNDGSTLTEVYTNSVVVNGNGTYTTTTQGNNPGGFTLPTTGLVAGTYGWFVDYSGDDNNTPADDQGPPDEEVVVNPASPTIFTAAGPTLVLNSGVALTDSATLTGGFNPGGTITFQLTGPGGTVVYSSVVTLTGGPTPVTVTNSQGVQSGSAVPTVAGTYQWVASFSGDPNNDPIASLPGVEPQQVVEPGAFITLVGPPVVVGSGVPLTDTAVLTAPIPPGGTITFELFAPSTTTNPVFTSVVTVTGNRVYRSDDPAASTTGSAVPTMAGVYNWVALYSGDGTNPPASTALGEEPNTVNRASPGIITAAGPTVVLGNGVALTDSATLTGGFNPGGTITFELFAPGTTTNPVFTNVVTVTGNGTYHSTDPGTVTGSAVPTGAGTYQWVVSYSGDPNNLEIASVFGAEPQQVDQASPGITTAAGPTLVIGSGVALTDSATLTGGFNPGGTIIFRLFAPNTTTNPVFTSVVMVTGNGTYHSTDPAATIAGSAVPTVAGTFQWVASYSGDANNHEIASFFGAEPQQVDRATPGITTGAGSTVVLNSGVALTDSATLTDGFNPGGTITFELFAPGGTVVYTSVVTLTGAATPVTVTNSQGVQSGSAVPTVAGTYQWVASFSGDPNNEAVSSAHGAEPQQSVEPGDFITLVGPTVVVGSGEALTDTAVLTAAVSPPGGTITFYLFAPGVTPLPGNTNAVYTSVVTLTGEPSPVTVTNTQGVQSGSAVPTVAGVYEWVALYSGDGTNPPAFTVIGGEPNTVDRATPGITTAAGPTLVIGSGVALTDSATLTGGFNPGGTITFDLTGPGGTVVYSSVVTLTGAATPVTVTNSLGVQSGSAVPTAPGTYQWVASYSGDPNNDPIASLLGDEPQQVNRASPGITTAAGPTLVIGSGVALTDSATLEGGFNPGGTVTFELTGPGGTVVYSSVVTLTGGPTPVTVTNSQGVQSGSAVPTAPGTYQWVASFSGDPNNDPIASLFGEEAQFVTLAEPTITTLAGPTVVLGSGVRLTDSATLTGGFNPGGTITFDLFLGSALVHTEMVTVNGNNTYTTPTGFLPTAAGTYEWVAIYGGDNNNHDVASIFGEEPQRVAPASPALTTTPNPATALEGTTLQDVAVLTGGFDPTGSITFSLYAPGVDPSVGPTAHTEMVTVNGNGTYDTTLGFVADAKGTWHWVAAYSGGPNNNPASSGPLDEPVTVPPSLPDVMPDFVAKVDLLGSNLQNGSLSLLPDALFVNGLYHDIPGRMADQAGLDFWVLDLQLGASRAAVASAFWESPEHRGLEVDAFYQTLLHRAADPAGRAGWVNALLAGATEQDVEVGFLTSAEYAAKHPGNTMFIEGLYANVLGRPADAREIQGWNSVLQSGTSRVAVAWGFLTSQEWATDEVNALYLQALGRPADPLGLALFVPPLQTRPPLELVADALFASDEFYLTPH